MGKVFLALAICVAAFIALLFIMSLELFTLPSSLVSSSKSGITQWEEVSVPATTQVLKSMEALNDHEQAFSAYSQDWKTELNKADNLQENGKRYVGELTTLIDTNSPSDAAVVRSTLKQLNASSGDFRVLAQNTAQPILVMTQLILQRKKIAFECRALVESLQGRALTALENTVGIAMQDWPEKADDLGKRLKRIQERGKKIAADLIICEQEAAKDSSDIDIQKFSTAVESIRSLAKNPKTEEKQLTALCKQLYTGWDEILNDMSITEGETVSFTHTIKRVLIPSALNKKDTVTPQEDISTNVVSRQEYEKHKNHLGMALRSKPVGRYNHEVESVAQPPGYSYIAKPEEKSNRYGEWRDNSRGQSYWAWYGQYSFMRSMFWGSYYRPIYMGGYNSYYGYHSMGRSYYGPTSNGRSRYGSGGSYTSSRYSSSRYVRSGGYKSSQYVKSGGTYRGTPRRTSSSSYRSSSYGGSRSGGGK